MNKKTRGPWALMLSWCSTPMYYTSPCSEMKSDTTVGFFIHCFLLIIIIILKFVERTYSVNTALRRLT